jgi:hypothetical protein
VVCRVEGLDVGVGGYFFTISYLISRINVAKCSPNKWGTIFWSKKKNEGLLGWITGGEFVFSPLMFPVHPERGWWLDFSTVAQLNSLWRWPIFTGYQNGCIIALTQRTPHWSLWFENFVFSHYFFLLFIIFVISGVNNHIICRRLVIKMPSMLFDKSADWELYDIKRGTFQNYKHWELYDCNTNEDFTGPRCGKLFPNGRLFHLIFYPKRGMSMVDTFFLGFFILILMSFSI